MPPPAFLPSSLAFAGPQSPSGGALAASPAATSPPLRLPASLVVGATPPAGAPLAPPSAKPGRSLSPTWRANAPAQELFVVNFFRLLQMGDEHGAAQLLARAPGLAVATRDGLTPLHAAVRAKSLPLAQLLLRAGADARAVDRQGRTAAEAAAAAGAADMAAWLHGAAEDVAVPT